MFQEVWPWAVLRSPSKSLKLLAGCMDSQPLNPRIKRKQTQDTIYNLPLKTPSPGEVNLLQTFLPMLPKKLKSCVFKR